MSETVKYCGAKSGANCCHYCGRDLSVEGFCADGKGGGNHKLKASAVCPFCGKDTPHSHGHEELISAIVGSKQRIATLEAVRDVLAEMVAIHVNVDDEESAQGKNLIEQCYYWYGWDCEQPPTLEMKSPCGECHLKPNEICDICGAMGGGNEFY